MNADGDSALESLTREVTLLKLYLCLRRAGDRLGRYLFNETKGRVLCFLIMVSVLSVSPLSAQTIYKWKDENGRWHFSQTPPATAQGLERRTMPAPAPLELPKDAPCSSFESGEIRHFKAHRPSDDFAHLQTTAFSVQLLEANRSRYTFSWKLSVKYNSLDREAVSGTVKLLDCYDFLVAEQPLAAAAVRPGEEGRFDGRIIVSMPAALKVGRFSASYGGTRPVRPAEKEKQPDPYRKPDIRVYYTQLQDAGSGAVYFVGEVYNVGAGRARNVKVLFTIKNERGDDVVKGSVGTNPDDLAPGQTGMFRKRILGLWAVQGYGWHSKAEWSE